MSKKKILLLCGIIVLAFVWVIQLIQTSGSGIKILELKDPITEIIIKQPEEDDIILTQEGSIPSDSSNPEGEKVEKWVLNNGQIAGNEHIMVLKDILSSIKVLNMVSSGNDIERYNLDKENAITIIAKNEDKVLRKLVIGKKASTNLQTYAQIDDSTDIVVISGIPGSIFPLTEDSLLPTASKEKPEEYISPDMGEALPSNEKTSEDTIAK